ncbi:MAG: helix-turn-helix domain-containing protein [Prevotella sp.]|nr:helix-turn-helix domain-containing protein [Prevotella sp.]
MRNLLTLLLIALTLGSLRAQDDVMSLTTENGLSDNSVTAFLMDRSGYMFIGTQLAVDRFDGENIVSIGFDNQRASARNMVSAMVEEDDDHLVVGNGIGLWRLDKQRLKMKRIFADRIDGPVIRMERYKGKIYIQTQRLLFCLIDGQLTQIRQIHWHHSPTLPQSNVRWRMHQSRSVNSAQYYDAATATQWRGYGFFGVDYTPYNRHVFHTYRLPDNLKVNIRSFLIDGDRMLIGTREGLYVIKGNDVTYIGPDVFGADVISQITRAGNHYFVGTIGNGFHLLDVNTLRSTGMMMPRANVYTFVNDHHGNIWVSTSAGVVRYELATNKSKVFTEANSQLPSNEVFCLGFDDQGTGYISTDGGLCTYDPQRKIIVANQLPRQLKQVDMFRTILGQRGGRLLMVPQLGMPFLYSPTTQKITTLHFDIYEPEPTLLDFISLGHNRYIFNTSTGIYYADGKTLRQFGHIDGLNDKMFQSHSLILSGRRIWVATLSSIVWADVDDIVGHKYSPIRLSFPFIHTNHIFQPEECNKVFTTHKITLSRQSRDLLLYFTPIIYANTKDLQFRYRMDGVDKEWRLANHDRNIFYKDLPFGTHHLHIEAVGMPEISCDLTIVVPLTYFAITMLLAVVLLIALSIHIIYCKRTKQDYVWIRLLPKPEKYRHNKKDNTYLRSLSKKLSDYMEDEKPYRTAGIQISDVAHALDCTSHDLSQLFTQYLHRNYYDYIAEQRVKDFQRLATQPAYAKYTISSLAAFCGFRSRSSFIAAFKKFTGMMPKEFMQKTHHKGANPTRKAAGETPEQGKTKL